MLSMGGGRGRVYQILTYSCIRPFLVVDLGNFRSVEGVEERQILQGTTESDPHARQLHERRKS